MASGAWDLLTTRIMYESAFRLAVVLAFAAIGEWIAERAGTLNISVEGMILGGAFTSAVGADQTGSIAFGLLCGMLGGLAIGWVQANLSHRLTANQFVVGLTLNVLAVGLTAFLDAEIEPVVQRASVVKVPLLHSFPLVGDAFFGQAWPAYLIYPLVPLAWWLMFRTRWGLEVRSVGENPQAADVSGIDVNARRRQSIYVCGLAAGLGGAFLVLGQVGKFEADGVAGRGFIAIAAVIFGGWTLRGLLLGSALFGLVQGLTITTQALGYHVNAQLLSAAPYIVTLVAMVFFAHRTRQPAALARPFVRGLT